MVGDCIMLRLATVFSGIGAIEHALQRLNIDHDIVFACDNGDKELSQSEEEIFEQLEKFKTFKEKKEYIDRLYSENKRTNFVEKSYKGNYNIEDNRYFQDIRFLDGRQFENEVDLFVGGSPCQSFSMVGKRGGFEDTRGTLFYEFARLVKEIQPRVFIYENVKGVISHDKGNTWAIMQNVFDDLGYTWDYQILNAKNYGVPQNRERIFVVGFLKDPKNFKFPEPIKLEAIMKDLLIDSVPEKYYLGQKGRDFVTKEKNLLKQYTQINGDISLCQKANQQFNWHGDFIYEESPLETQEKLEKYYLSEKVEKYVLSSGTKNFYSKPEINLDVARPLLSSMHKMHRAGVDNYVTSNGKIRKLTPRECLRLMGFLDTFNILVSDTQMYRQSGNSIVVDVLMHIMIQILKVEDLTKKNEVQLSLNLQ